MRRILLWTCLALLAAPLQADDRPPNVILINTDDLGYGDVGAYGAELVETPNIDRLAAEGTRFTDAHSASAVCSPSRYGLVTGSYPARADQWFPLFWKSPLTVDPDSTTIADVMQDAGYATAAIGKWHLGFGTETPVDWNAPLRPGPLELGFDHYYGIPVLNSHPPFVWVEDDRIVGWTAEDPVLLDTPGTSREFDEKFHIESVGGAVAAHALYVDREVGTTLVERANGWIEAQADGPFFLYLATTHIHHPFTPAPRFIGTSRAGAYGDFIHELDWMVGELMATLQRLGLDEDTLVIFTSDNGGMFNRGGQTAWEAGHRLNGDLLGMKFGAWEGGHRVPLIVRWPGQVPAGRVSDALVGNVDFLATLAALVGRELGPGEGVDSVDQLPELLGAAEAPLREELVISPANRKHLALRQGRWMYISSSGEGGFTGERPGMHDFGGPAVLAFTGQVNSDVLEGRLREDAPPAQLYDLQADPRQTRNVYREHPEIARRMSERLKALLD